jgi:general secretion pathway protein D
VESRPVPEPPDEPPQPEVSPEPPPPLPVRPMPVRPKPVWPLRPSERGAAPPGPGPQSQPALPADDLLPKEGQTPSEPVSFDFPDTPLSNVIESIARMTGKNFDVDPSIATQRVTVITHDKIPPEMAYEVLQSILYSRQLSLVPTLDGHLIKIVAIGESLEKIPIKKGTKDVSKRYDELATHIVTVKHADASELTEFLRKMGSRGAVVDAYAKTNTLIITDNADGLRRMFTFLEQVDIPGFDTDMEIFTLEYARAEVLAQQIQEVLMGTGGAPMPQRPGMPEQVRRAMPQPIRPSTRPTVPGQQPSMVVGSKEQTLRIVPDERLNSLIVIAAAELMEHVRDLVAKLDTPTPYEANNMNVYKLLNANAEKVEKALNAILGTTPRQAGEKAPAQTGEIQPFEKKVVVTHYEQNNALLVLASPQDYKLIREIIAQLDVPQRQVLVEAVIMDVSIQNTYGLAVDAAAVTGKDAFGLTSTSNLNSLVSAANLATSLTDGTAPVTMARALLGLGTQGGISAGLYDSIEIKVPNTSGGTTKVKVPFVPLLLKSLETLTDVDILSQPSLTTEDNQPADIVVGQELPIPEARSGYSYSPSSTGQQQTIPAYGLTSYGRGISRQDVGVKMKVTPHINEGDYVSLETEIEVSEATPSNVGIDVNDLGPTLNKSKVKNNVVVRDGTTGVIGGLIKETTNRTRNQTPILGDLPMLGWLFRSKSNTRKKQNVVVLITPYIIKEGIDLDRVSKHKMDEWRDANVDILFQQGIIKKVKKSFYMRNKHRPSIIRGEEMQNEEPNFGRGDIKR